MTDALPIMADAETELPTVPLPWLTAEAVLYSALLLLAIGLRLWNLDHYPLSNVEAAQSMVALQLVNGEAMTAIAYSPLLVSLQSFLFFLFGDSDSTARLATVLLGTGLLLLPLTLRRQLGLKTCLMATVLLAISSTPLFLSRTVNGEIGVAVGSLMIVAGFINWAAERNRNWLWFMMGGLAVLLAAGPLSLSIGLIFATLVGVGLGLFFKASPEEALHWVRSLTYPDPPPPEAHIPAEAQPPHGEDSQPEESSPTEGENPPAALSAPHGEDSQPEKQSHANPANPPTALSEWQQAGLLFAAMLAILTTTASLNISGFSMLTNTPLSWVNYFASTFDAGYNALALLLIYDPIILIFGLIGLGYAMLRSDLLGLIIGGWFVTLLVLDVLMGGRPQGAVILPLVPLTLLAASAIAAVWDGLEAEGSWYNEGLLFVMGLIITATGYIYLVAWLNCNNETTLCEYGWVPPLGLALLIVTVAALLGTITSYLVSVRGGLLILFAVLLLFTVNSGSRLNYGPLQNLAYQPLAGLSPSTEFPMLVDTLVNFSQKKGQGNNLLDLMVVGPFEPALQWQLRDFPNITQVTNIVENPTASAIITPANQDVAAVGEAYLGQSFTMDAFWSPAPLSLKPLLSWGIFHEHEQRPQGNQQVLWLRIE